MGGCLASDKAKTEEITILMRKIKMIAASAEEKPMDKKAIIDCLNDIRECADTGLDVIHSPPTALEKFSQIERPTDFTLITQEDYPTTSRPFRSPQKPDYLALREELNNKEESLRQLEETLKEFESKQCSQIEDLQRKHQMELEEQMQLNLQLRTEYAAKVEAIEFENAKLLEQVDVARSALEAKETELSSALNEIKNLTERLRDMEETADESEISYKYDMPKINLSVSDAPEQVKGRHNNKFLTTNMEIRVEDSDERRSGVATPETQFTRHSWRALTSRTISPRLSFGGLDECTPTPKNRKLVIYKSMNLIARLLLNSKSLRNQSNRSLFWLLATTMSLMICQQNAKSIKTK